MVQVLHRGDVLCPERELRALRHRQERGETRVRAVIITVIVLAIMAAMRGKGDDCPPYSYYGCERKTEPIVQTLPASE